MTSFNFIYKRLSLTGVIALLFLVFCLGACGGMEEDVNLPGAEESRETYSVGIPMQDLVSPGLSEEQLKGEFDNIWIGLFASEGNLKKRFVIDDGIKILDGKPNLTLTRGLVSTGDILAIAKGTTSEFFGEISTIEKLRSVKFDVKDIQGDENSVLYGERTLKAEDCGVCSKLNIDLKRPFAKIEFTDKSETEGKHITEIVMKNCPKTGKLSDALIEKGQEAEDCGYYGSVKFQKGDDGIFRLYVPYRKFQSNEAESDERALTLTLKDGSTREVWLTKYENGKPVATSGSDTTDGADTTDSNDPSANINWHALWPNHRYPFTYTGTLTSDPPLPEIKDKIRIRWNYAPGYGKFNDIKLYINNMEVTEIVSDINNTIILAYDLTGKPKNKILYKIYDVYNETYSAEGDLIIDAGAMRDENGIIGIINYDDYTLFTISGENSQSATSNVRFYCRDIGKYEFDSIELNGYSFGKIKFQTDIRGYKYADFPSSVDYYFRVTLYCTNGTYLTLEEYFYLKDVFINPIDDCLREYWDGNWYKCFYFN